MGNIKNCCVSVGKSIRSTMKKTFVTAIVVGGSMLASESTAA